MLCKDCLGLDPPRSRLGDADSRTSNLFGRWSLVGDRKGKKPKLASPPSQFTGQVEWHLAGDSGGSEAGTLATTAPRLGVRELGSYTARLRGEWQAVPGGADSPHSGSAGSALAEGLGAGQHSPKPHRMIREKPV